MRFNKSYLNELIGTNNDLESFVVLVDDIDGNGCVCHVVSRG